MLKIAIPVILTYLGIMLMGMVDAVFVGRVSPVAIGAVGVGTSLYYWFMMFGVGLLAGLDFLASYAVGANRPEDGHHAWVQALYTATLASLPLTIGLLTLNRHLDILGISPDVRIETQAYLQILAYSLWPTLLFTSCRQYLTASGDVLPSLITLLFANLVNAGLNFLLVFGNWGFPKLGSAGSAWATLVSRVLMMALLFSYLAWKDMRQHQLFKKAGFGWDSQMMKDFLKLGIPSAIQHTLEVGVFGLSTTLAARLQATSLAAHQIVLNIASFTFMIPLGISVATSVLVGQAVGSKNLKEAQTMGWKGISLGTTLMALSGLTLYLAPIPILGIFTRDVAVLSLGTEVLFLAALFQIADGLQVVATGALRGLGDTRKAMLINLFGHWAVGLPISLYLCFQLQKGVWGLWVGLSSGLAVVAALLLLGWIFEIRTKKVRPHSEYSSAHPL